MTSSVVRHGPKPGPLIASLLLGVALSSAAPAAPPPAIFPFSPAEAKAHQHAWATSLGQPQATTNSVGMSLVLIPPGRFLMGSPAAEKGRNESETQHQVTLTKAFYVAATEVTQGQWQAVMGKNPSFCLGDSLRWKPCPGRRRSSSAAD